LPPRSALARAQAFDEGAAVGQRELEVQRHAPRSTAGPAAAGAQLRLGHVQVELVELPLALPCAPGQQPVHRQHLQPAELAPAQLEVIDHDVQRRHAGRRLAEQVLDRGHLGLRHRQPLQPGHDATCLRAVARRPVVDVAGQLVGLQAGLPAGLGGRALAGQRGLHPDRKRLPERSSSARSWIVCGR
jgi:hypothetical protein